MSRRGKGRGARTRQDEEARERVALERRLRDRIDHRPDQASAVTARGAKREPFHRWHPYRQGFSPALIRRFLDEAKPTSGPILDPFSGSGTTVLECARQGRAAIGGDAILSLGFVARGAFEDAPEAWPEDRPQLPLEDAWKTAENRAARRAVLLALARRHDGEGHAKGDVSDDPRPLDPLIAMMREDLQTPPAATGAFLRSDARELPLADRSCGGCLTSPPYLSRYDYTRVNDPWERLFRDGGGRRRDDQLRASKATAGRKDTKRMPLHPAAEEAAERLEADGQPKLARALRGYFLDMDRVLAEVSRVLEPGAPLWFVVAGADLKRHYVPSGLIIADGLEAHGFDLESIEEVRKLRSSGRRLGELSGVSPREVILEARRR